MDEAIFTKAFASISSGEYSEEDVKLVKQWVEELSKKESIIKRKAEQTKNNFVKNKDKAMSELKRIKNDKKAIRNILKTIWQWRG